MEYKSVMEKVKDLGLKMVVGKPIGHWYKKKYKLIGDEVKLVYYKNSDGREYNKKCSIYEYKGVRVNFKK